MPMEEVGRRVEELMEMLGISKLRDRAPHTLSGGERKRSA
jgi:ABC-type cobalt transport system, ATPase component